MENEPNPQQDSAPAEQSPIKQSPIEQSPTPAEATSSPRVERAYILCHFADESSVYRSWLEQLPIPHEVVSGYTPNWQPPEDAAIVITHMHYAWEELSILRKLHEKFPSLPVLILSDGILEYRNTWEHPDLPAGSMFQPLFGHKLACISKSQARIVESWGNVGRCEVVGLPRLDSAVEKWLPPLTHEGPFRILVATANTPAFNDEQRAAVISGLAQLRKTVEHNPVVNGRPLEVVWRLTTGLDEEIGLPAPPTGKAPPLSDVIDEVHAVITTPSTLYLESVVKKRPTAILDFHNSPMYVASAWTINAPIHVRHIIEELESRPAPKMMFQDFVLEENLECRTPATPRLMQLIETMIEQGRVAKKNDDDLKLPYRILNDPEKGFFPVLDSFELNRLYPDNEIFQNDDVSRLQVELEAATKRLDSAPLEITKLRNQCLNYSRLIAEMQEARDSANAVIDKMNEQIDGLKDRQTDLQERFDAQQEHVKSVKDRFGVLQTAYQNLKKWKTLHEKRLELAKAKKEAAADSDESSELTVSPDETDENPDADIHLPSQNG